ncbi:uncharacterized protein LOC132981837 isoform X1 [Labrus mixtus]|uniref:uncharacterized protein LOC132981837 isoform X1 n=2 Tax=Labrus mixtus TaxID=508554 RepID=UPI0029BFB4F6|nr:uncharacterized protein LOC132981837 isoform X1 [Labrus mixtus]
MEAVFRLFVLLIGVSHGLETFCDGRQDGARCYGALGGTLVLKLMDDASAIYKYQWLNKTRGILSARKNKIVHNMIETRSTFTPNNGIFRISNLSMTDAGEYALEIFDSQGYKVVHQTQQFTIEAPVSSVLLVSECLSQGEIRASCSSEGGDSPQYSWTLDGRTLTHTQLLSGNNDTNNITLKQDVSGRLVCSVRNHISGISACGFIYINCTLPNGTYIPHWAIKAINNRCIEPTTSPNWINTDDQSLLLYDVLAAVVILISIGIVIYFVWKKNQFKTAEGSAVPEMMENLNTSVLHLNRHPNVDSYPL